jgi:uncharacterized protein (DUF433 family)
MTTAAYDIGELLEARPDFHQGRPCIRGTKITVHTIAAHHWQGMDAAELHENFPSASEAGIYAALAYCHANREQIEADLDEDVRWGEERIAEQEAAWDAARR